MAEEDGPGDTSERLFMVDVPSAHVINFVVQSVEPMGRVQLSVKREGAPISRGWELDEYNKGVAPPVRPTTGANLLASTRPPTPRRGMDPCMTHRTSPAGGIESETMGRSYYWSSDKLEVDKSIVQIRKAVLSSGEE
mmetsp:Transcript_6846/g.25267  ORF Transcript_6846/g.25267 Transcript_6846/m.25267 type:complete len:137 (-) Transcript_6846:1256-1666(-)